MITPEAIAHRAGLLAQENDPVDLIHEMMGERGLRQRDLICAFGQRSHASEVLARRRKLSLPMIRALVVHFGMPADKLIQDYKLAGE